MVQETPKSLLDKTKEIILEKGWTQNAYRDEEGRVCLSEALRQATIGADFFVRIDAYTFLRRATQAVSPSSWEVSNIIGYNDVVAHTKEDILAVLDRAIQLATP